MQKVKKALKITGKVLLIILALLILSLLIMFIVHRIMTSSERKMLEEKGYVNLVSAGDYDLNLCSYGSDAPDHTIVAISGFGVQDYSVTLRNMTDRFADKNKIVIADRAGYGLSDDTDVEQTAERVVEDLRTALKNGGFEAPYILLPHSLGGIYATLWESKYPGEIEGILFLDCSQLGGEGEIFDEYEPGFMDTFYYAACKIGLQRLFYEKFDPFAFVQAEAFDLDAAKALTWQNAAAKARSSEEHLENTNAKYVRDHIVNNDVLKIYINASSGMETKEELLEFYSYYESMLKKAGKEPLNPRIYEEDVIQATLKGYKEWADESIYPYAENMGNCEVVNIPGDHYIYIQKPDECAEQLQRLIDKIEQK